MTDQRTLKKIIAEQRAKIENIDVPIRNQEGQVR